MKSTARGKTRDLIRAIFICIAMVLLTTTAFAEENTDSLKDKGVKELNSAYEYTIHTGGDAVGASAGMSYGGWSSLGSKLSYMEFPEGSLATNGKDGLWCYCIDITTSTKDGHKYSVTTLDAAEYYEEGVSGKIRSILINSYPHLSVSELEERFALTGLTEEEAFVATQWIIWYYSNPDGLVHAGGDSYYPANIYKPSEYPGDIMSVWYDDENGNEVYVQSENVVKLAKALDSLPAADAYVTEPVNIVVEKRIYEDKVIFDARGTENLEALKNLSVSVKDEIGKEVPFAISGNKIVVETKDLTPEEEPNKLTVEISAEQVLAEDVYFFSPEGGRSASQSRVAVYSGTAPVAVSTEFGYSRATFDSAEKDAQLKVTKKVLLNGAAHRTENTYYVALFEDVACTLPAYNGNVREIRMGGEAIGSVVFDELVAGKTYYVAETDIDGRPLKDGDQGIATIAYDKQQVIVDTEFIAEVTVTNCYEEEEKKDDGGGIGDGDMPGEELDSSEENSESDGTKIDMEPDTGDYFDVLPIMTLMTLAMIGMVSILLFRRREAK